MNELPIDLAILLLVAGGGIATLVRARSLEKRILSIERSLGALSSLGAAGGDPYDDDQVLRHLEAMTLSLIGQNEAEKKTPNSTEEP